MDRIGQDWIFKKILFFFGKQDPARAPPQGRTTGGRIPIVPARALSKRLQDGPRRPQDTSKTLQDGSKRLQGAPRCLQDAPKTLPQDAPRRPQDASKTRCSWIWGAKMEPCWYQKSHPKRSYGKTACKLKTIIFQQNIHDLLRFGGRFSEPKSSTNQ